MQFGDGDVIAIGEKRAPVDEILAASIGALHLIGAGEMNIVSRLEVSDRTSITHQEIRCR
jgi:hypothetical protein